MNRSLKNAWLVAIIVVSTFTIVKAQEAVKGIRAIEVEQFEKAKTIYKVLDKNSEASLVELKPITGRKHQLRKQLYALGQPIFGDIKYKLSNSARGLNKNLMLHSYQIKFMINDKKYTYTALLPDYFKKLLKTKRLKFPNS